MFKDFFVEENREEQEWENQGLSSKTEENNLLFTESNRKSQLASKRGKKSKEGPRSRKDSGPRAIVTVGLPGSGKSTIARHMVAQGNTDQHEFDKSRRELGMSPKDFSPELAAHTFAGARRSAEEGRNTALTNTSIPKLHRQDAVQKLRDAGYENVDVVLSPGSTKAALRRNRKRSGSKPGESEVPQFVMNRMAQGMESIPRSELRTMRNKYNELHKQYRFTKPAMKRSGALREAAITFSDFIAEARKNRRRLRIIHTTHYTSPSIQSDILQNGLRQGTRSDGAYHDRGMNVLYTTPSSRVGADYGTRAVHFKVMNPEVTRIASPKTYGARVKDWMRNSSDDDLVNNRNRPEDPHQETRRLIRGGSKVIIIPDAHGGYDAPHNNNRGDYIILDKDVANRSIDRNPLPVIRGFRSKVKRKIREDLNLVERNRFEREAEQRKGLPFSRSEIERQRNQRHLRVSGGIGSESEDPRLHILTVNDRREDNKEIYQKNAKRKNYNKRIIAYPIEYGSGNDIFSSLNVTNQHARKGISYDHKQLLKFLRRRRLERNFLRSPSE